MLPEPDRCEIREDYCTKQGCVYLRSLVENGLRNFMPETSFMALINREPPAVFLCSRISGKRQ
jgi:hypothetical protein